MNLELYQVDAFTSRLFQGNPAAVIPLRDWLDDALLQKIALENNLSETAFIKPSSEPGIDFDIRWFTPLIEIDLCGHATLAAAWVVFNKMDFKGFHLHFKSKSGKLAIEKRADVIVMDFPSWKPERMVQGADAIIDALNATEVVGVYENRDVLVELLTEADVLKCKPDFSKIKDTGRHVIITAPGQKDIDFVSRFFAPAAGIDEDPVTGSAHSQLIPFWSEKLNKKKMLARQLSSRGGELECKWWGDRVTMAGQCVFYMKGEIDLGG